MNTKTIEYLVYRFFQKTKNRFNRFIDLMSCCQPKEKSTICMNPGPIEFDHAVLKQMHHKGISHVDKSFINIFGESLEMMREVGSKT